MADALPARLVELLPTFAAELERGLRVDGEDDLAAQVSGLVVEHGCGCGDDFCSSFYTGARPNGPWGESHRCVTPMVPTGMVVLDVVDGRIRYVEVLDRDDVKVPLLEDR